MKMHSLTAVVFVLTIVAGFAQTSNKAGKQLPPIEKKSLDLKYLGKDSAVLERIKGSDSGSSFLKDQPDGNMNKETLNSEMPVMKPDSPIQFHILAAKPDSAILYHIQVKKPN